MANSGGSAFPGGQILNPGSEDYGLPFNPGMTLRDYFAAKAMQGDWASQGLEIGYFPANVQYEELLKRAKTFYQMADAMIEARQHG